jgi:hypothetical protein
MLIQYCKSLHSLSLYGYVFGCLLQIYCLKVTLLDCKVQHMHHGTYERDFFYSKVCHNSCHSCLGVKNVEILLYEKTGYACYRKVVCRAAEEWTSSLSLCCSGSV